MSSATIFHSRDKLTPYEYPACYEAWEKSVQSPWFHGEVDMTADIQDWASLDETDRQIIAGILRGFTIIEQRIGCYWRDTVAAKFHKPEIQAMAVVFSAQETVHAYAYNHLESSLGLDTYEAFLQDDTAQAKLALYEQSNNLSVSLASFSGGGEAISLFGSFAILLSYCKTGKLKGLKQILSWSVRDEQQHSDMGCYLYSQLPEHMQIPGPFIANILLESIEAELAFIANANLPEAQVSAIELFLHKRATNVMQKLGYKPSKDYFMAGYDTIGEWFYPLVQTSTLHDFFTSPKNGSAYAGKLKQNFQSIDYTSFSSMG